jgi:hypothetical protein
MQKPRARVTVLFAAMLSTGLLLVMALPSWADAPPGPYFNGFESNTSNWFDTSNGGNGSITRQQSGYTNAGQYADLVSSASGAWHARLSGDPCVVPASTCYGPFTRWGGYNQTFPIGGYRTQVDVYLDVGWAATHPDARFDFSSAINMSDGTFLRDFVFNAGTNRTSDTANGFSPGFFINASTNATRSGAFPENPCPNPGPSSTPPNPCRTPVHITTSGWYTFRHTFEDDGGFLAVNFAIFPLGNSTSVASWTIHSGDAMSTVGGNRYGWFVNEEIPDLAIDNSQRTGLNIGLTPATATNAVGTNHTVTATATSTDPNDHPSRGPGVAVEFDVTSGPNTGQTSHPANTGTCAPSNCTTDANGQVSWTYTSNGVAGTDTIRACFPDRPVVVQRPGDEARTCTTATKVWAVTSGKVTGGGQIQGDPVFSVDGVLLSVPALVPSLANPKSQASFGFVVQASGGTPTGNLEYNDKPADVRVKATSFASLFITSGSCGPNTHATFSGTAAVTRSTGTTSESFTVQVDDCGEPGTADMFGITTTGGYSNGPSTLIGGNIQIHK